MSYLVVLSPFGRLSHYTKPGDARTLCGIPCEFWPLARNTRRNLNMSASCSRCSKRAKS